MPQLHFYVPEEIAEKVREKAQAAEMSVSRYIAEVIKRQVTATWPEDFFNEIVGKWQGEPLHRPAQGVHEQREVFSPSEEDV